MPADEMSDAQAAARAEEARRLLALIEASYQEHRRIADNLKASHQADEIDMLLREVARLRANLVLACVTLLVVCIIMIIVAIALPEFHHA